MIGLTTFLLLAQLDAPPRRPIVSAIDVVQGFAAADHAAILSLTYDPWVLAIHDLADGAEVRRIELADPAFTYWEYAGVATTRVHPREVVLVGLTRKDAAEHSTRRIVCVAPDGAVRRVAESTSRERSLGVCVLQRRSGAVLAWRADSDELNARDRFELVDLASGARDPHAIEIPAGKQRSSALATLPDVDGDGSAELVVGAPWGAPEECSGGSVYVYSGAELKLVRRITNADVPATLRTCGLGAVVARVPDLDGDGRDDLAVTASGIRHGAHVPACANANRREFVFLFGGVTGAFIAAVELPSDQDSPITFGCAITALGDVDADGTGDFAIGQSSAFRGGTPVGGAYVVSGKSRRVLSSVWGVPVQNDFGCALAADRATGRLVVCDLNDVFVFAVSSTACVRERTLRLR